MRSHVRSLDAAMASLHDTIIEVRRDTEATFILSRLAVSDGEEDTVAKVKNIIKDLSSDDATNVISCNQSWPCKERTTNRQGNGEDL